MKLALEEKQRTIAGLVEEVAESAKAVLLCGGEITELRERVRRLQVPFELISLVDSCRRIKRNFSRLFSALIGFE